MSIKLNKAAYSYFLPDDREIQALLPMTLSVRPGEFVAVVGANGSGKSTLAKLMNGLLTPTSGTVEVDGCPTSDAADSISARRAVGMVFQNPDNQLIATIVEDDVAFGPENLGVPPAEIRTRIDESLAAVGMSDHCKSDPHYLSAGQRQKIAIAGVLAMRPSYLIMDEPTSMLDPAGRQDVLDTLAYLRQKNQIGIVYITHIIEEVVQANRVVVLKEGQKIADGAPSDILSDEKLMASAYLYVTKANRLARQLAAKGVPISTSVITIEEVTKGLCSLT